MNNVVINPYEYFADPTKGRPIFNGSIYVGIPDTDPEVPANQKQVYARQENGTDVAIPQPVATNAGGYPTYNGSVIAIVVNGSYSIKVNDKNGVQAFYSAFIDGSNFVAQVATIDDLRLLEPTFDGQQVQLLGHTVAGIGGGVFYSDYSSVAADDNGVTVVTTGGKRWLRKLDGFVTPQMFGAIGDGLHDDTHAIQSAIVYLNITGGGDMILPRGSYLVIKENPTSVGDDPDDYAIHFYGNNIKILGDGGAKLVRDPTLPRYIMVRWGPLPIINGQTLYTNSHIEGVEFDGKYIINPDDSPDNMMLVWAHGLKDSSIKSCYMHNSSHYGLGMQNGGRINFSVVDVVIEDTLHDGLDIKNNGSNDRGTVIDRVTVRRFGRATNIVTPFAGIDLMGECKLSNITIEDYGDIGTQNAGVRFKQGEVGDDRGFGAHYSMLENFTITGNAGGDYEFDGVAVTARDVKVSSGAIHTVAGSGVECKQSGGTISSVSVTNSSIGFRTSDSTYTTNGDNCTFSQCTSSGGSLYGFRVETTGVDITNCVSDNDNVGLDLRSGGIDLRWIGGEIKNAITSKVINSGINTYIDGCRGVQTESRIKSTDVLIDTVGTKTISVSHGLPFTPLNTTISGILLRSANNVPSEISTLRVSGVSSTISSMQFNVITASPVVGDTVNVVIETDSRYIPNTAIN